MVVASLTNVSKSYSDKINECTVALKSANLTINYGEKLGILGLNGAGKTTICKLITKAEPASEGKVFNNGKVSWPIGIFNSLSEQLTGLENIRFFSTVFDLDEQSLIEQIIATTDLGESIKSRVSTFSAGMKARLAFFIAFSIDFDLYVTDEIVSVGDIKFREKASLFFSETIKNKSLILCSHDENLIKKHVANVYVVDKGNLSEKMSVDEGIKYYNEHVKIKIKT